MEHEPVDRAESAAMHTAQSVATDVTEHAARIRAALRPGGIYGPWPDSLWGYGSRMDAAAAGEVQGSLRIV
jgi:hypothetical protein